MSCGSLKSSKTTAWSSLKAGATLRQNVGEWSASAITCWPRASSPPGALRCSSRSTRSPWLSSRCTNALDRLPVRRSAVRRVDAVDAEPAVLVERDAHDVGLPGGHRRDGRVVRRPVEDAPALRAGILGAGPVQPDQLDDVAVSVDQVVALHVDDPRALEAAEDDGDPPTPYCAGGRRPSTATEAITARIGFCGVSYRSP